VSTEPTLPDAPSGARTVYRGKGSRMRLDRGADTGRVVDSDGTITFVLGNSNRLEQLELVTGEYVEASKIVDLTDYDLISIDAEAVADLTASASAEWRAQILLDDVLLGELKISADSERGLTDLRVPVRRYDREHAVSFRLALVEV